MNTKGLLPLLFFGSDYGVNVFRMKLTSYKVKTYLRLFQDNPHLSVTTLPHGLTRKGVYWTEDVTEEQRAEFDCNGIIVLQRWGFKRDENNQVEEGYRVDLIRR